MDLHDKDMVYELEMCRALLDAERRKTLPNTRVVRSLVWAESKLTQRAIQECR